MCICVLRSKSKDVSQQEEEEKKKIPIGQVLATDQKSIIEETDVKREKEER